MNHDDNLFVIINIRGKRGEIENHTVRQDRNPDNKQWNYFVIV